MTLARSFALLLACATVATRLQAQADTIPPPHEPLAYEITLATSDTGAHIVAEVQTGWRLHSVRPVELGLDSTLRVVRVLVDGKPNTRLSRTMYAREGSTVVVPHEKPPGDTLSTRVRYHGIPRGGMRVGLDRAGRRALAGESAGNLARLWLPVPDSLDGRTAVTYHIQASEGQRVVANGTLEKVDTLNYGHFTWHFRLATPIPLQSFALAVGRFAVTTLPRTACAAPCAPVTVWTAPEDSAAALRGPLGQAGAIADFLAGLLGPLPYPSLAHVAVPLAPLGRGASVVLYDADRVHQGKLAERDVALATAAQWFGNVVTESGPMAERPSPAVAAYLALLWERRGGKRSGGAAPAPQVEAVQRLHRTVGDSVFFRGLRRYVEAHRNATAEAGALERTMSDAAGKPLDWSYERAVRAGR